MLVRQTEFTMRLQEIQKWLQEENAGLTPEDIARVHTIRWTMKLQTACHLNRRDWGVPKPGIGVVTSLKVQDDAVSYELRPTPREPGAFRVSRRSSALTLLDKDGNEIYHYQPPDEQYHRAPPRPMPVAGRDFSVGKTELIRDGRPTEAMEHRQNLITPAKS